MTIEKTILKEIVVRLERLERVFLPSKGKPARSARADDKKYKGATGGIRLLADEGYFNKRRLFGEICKAL